MIIFLVSECPTTESRLRHLLSQLGHECPFNHVASYGTAPDVAAAAQPKSDLIVFVISGDADRALEVLRQLRESPGTRILAIGPADSSMILGAVRAGAQDYLDEEGDLPRGLATVLTGILESQQKRATLGQVTTVISANGGSGRTVIATNLAVLLAKAHGRCGLFDFDLRGSDIATFLGLTPRHTIADLCRNIDKIDNTIWEQAILDHSMAVSVLASPETWDEARHVTADGMQKVLRLGRTVFPHIVVDMDFFSLTDHAPLLLESTTILLLFRLDFAAVRNATRAVQYLNTIGVDSDNLQLAASRYGKNRYISPAQAEAVLGTKIRHFVPEDPLIVDACINCGVAVVTEAPRSPFAKAIASIAATLAHGEPSSKNAGRTIVASTPAAKATKNGAPA